MKKRFPLDKKQMRRQFDRVAKTYEAHAVAYQEIADRLLDKLEFIKINPQRIVDLGCGLGNLMSVLGAKYPEAQVIGVDLSYGMLNEGMKKYPEQQVIQADSAFLPLPDESVELVMSNLMFPWCDDLASIFAEVRRVLTPNGLFLFATLGPDTLKELRTAWAEVDEQPRVHVFLDMHDLGDVLLSSGLSDPVMDVDHFSMCYQKFVDFLTDLRFNGSATVLRQRAVTLLTPSKLRLLEREYQRFQYNNRFPVTYEVVYGHAWKGSVPSSSHQSDEFYFPVDWLKK